MIKSLNTKSKLFILPVLFIGIVFVSGMAIYYFNSLSKARNDIAILTGTYKKDTLEGRVHVYKFFLNTIEEERKTVLDKFEDLIKNVESFETKLDLESDIKSAKELVVLYKEYLKNFDLLSSELIKDKNYNDKKYLENLSNIGIQIEEKLSLIDKSAVKLRDEAQSTLNFILLFIGISSIVVFITAAYFLSKIIVGSINKFQDGLLGFFAYLNKETNDVKLLDIEGSDEFAKMSEIVNQNIEKIKKLIQDDDKLINNVKLIVELVKTGDISKKISLSTNNKSLEELKVIFNEMLETISSKVAVDLNELENSLVKYQSLDFSHRTSNPQGLTLVSLNKLADTINEMLVENKSNGLTLLKSSEILLKDVESLSSSSTSAARSLEDTAVSLEQIMNSVNLNNNNVSIMSNYANTLSVNAKEGENLASQTTISMDEINEKVEAIHQAIEVIDQIAFQTNILSLNAAVEAATAGEAGKGFAVVAQEVRNLASRSAQAANEIKHLVENATNKANEGKTISHKMILGYNELNDTISKTLGVINEVEKASNEQKYGIAQINESIKVLEQQTQRNAQIASETKEIANQTEEIAKTIVDNANSKEFIGKNEVTAK